VIHAEDSELRKRKLRIGILGTARIARQFAQGVAPSETVEVIAIASRDAHKAEEFAHEMAIPRSAGRYEDLLTDPELDALYVPLPHSLHAEWVVRAAAAGKHVLCEKPLALDGAQARAMFKSAEEAGVVLVEGYPYLAQPQTAKLRALLDAKAIGPLHLIRGIFGFTMNHLGDFRLDCAQGGGALMDVGCYPVSLVRVLSHERPVRVHAFARRTSSGVDQTLVATLEHESGLLAEISCSFATPLYRRAEIFGTAGMIETSYSNHTSTKLPAELHLRRGVAPDSPRETLQLNTGNGFRLQAEAFRQHILTGAATWSGVQQDVHKGCVVTLDP
jgi:D-xylose 1-dehydrogenase (NADP+, D-xylono-1,5-lactone-forming)